MPIYRERDRYRVRVWVGGRSRTWRLPVGTSLADAEAFEAQKRLELRANPEALAPPSTAPRFSDFCVDSYSPHAKSVLATSTYRNRVYQIATLVEHFGDLRLHAIRIEDVERFVAARRAEKIGPAKIQDDLKVLAAVLSYARRRKILVPPLDTKELVRSLRAGGQQRKIRAWSQTDVGRLLACVERLSPALLPLVVCLANTGLRKGEAIRLRSQSVDLAAGVLWVEPSKDWRPKSGKARAVPISAALRPWLTEERLAGEYVFTAPRTGGRWEEWPQLAFDRARKAANLEGGPHHLRHFFASAFLAAGGSMWELSRILGHSERRTTELYAHFQPEAVAAAANRVNIGAPIGPAEHAAKLRWRKPV